MGIFANTAIRESYGYAPDVLSDVQLRQFDAEDTMFESALIALAESDSEWRDIMDQMAAKEYAVLESTGQEMVYEAVDVKGFFEKVVDWFKKLWAKIAGLFSKFLQAIQTKVSDDAKFLQKYEKKITTGYNLIPSGGIAFKGHDFEHIADIDYQSIADVSASSENKTLGVVDVYESVKTTGDKKDIQAMKKALDKFRTNKTKIEDNVRGAALYGKSGKSVAANEFNKKCREYLFGKEYTQFTGKGKQMSAADIINEIKTGKFAKEQCKINYNQLKNSINQTIAEINNMAKNSVNMNVEDELRGLKMAAANLITGLYRTTGNIYQTINGVQLSAMNARHSQARSLAMKCVQLADKETAVNASTVMDTEDLESMMEY